MQMDAPRILSWIVEVPFKREMIRLGNVIVDNYKELAPAGYALEPSAAARDNIRSIGDLNPILSYAHIAYIVNSEIIAVGCEEFPIAFLNGG